MSRGSETRQLTKLVGVRMHSDELAAAKRLAEEQGHTVASLLRELLNELLVESRGFPMAADHPTTSTEWVLMFDGAALLDKLNEANLVSSHSDGVARTWDQRRADSYAASRAFDVADAFFGPLLSALYGDIATLRAARERDRDRDEPELAAIRARLHEIERYEGPWHFEGSKEGPDWLVGYPTDHPAGGLIATVPDYGYGLAEFIAHARTDIPALLADVERLRALYTAAKAVVDAGRCAGLGSVGAALVVAVEAVTHPGGET